MHYFEAPIVIDNAAKRVLKKRLPNKSSPGARAAGTANASAPSVATCAALLNAHRSAAPKVRVLRLQPCPRSPAHIARADALRDKPSRPILAGTSGRYAATEDETAKNLVGSRSLRYRVG